MRGIVWTQPGAPEVLAAREIADVHAAAGQVRVRAEASPVLWIETRMRSGAAPSPGSSPMVFGSQAVGVVDEVGDGVDPRLIGTRVAVSGVAIGAHAEFVCAAAQQCVAVPDAIGAVEAAAVLTGAPVALALLERAGDLRDATVLVEAAGSGIGAYLTQLLRGRVGRVVATAGSDESRTRAELFGADIVLDHADLDRPGALEAAAGGHTIDVAFDSIGGSAARHVLGSLTPLHGRLLSYGMLSGQAPDIAAADLYAGGYTVTACAGPAWLERVAELRATALDRIVDGTISPVIDSTMSLGAVAAAHRRVDERATRGTIVLVP
ncbi:NADPH2:quinone reductase [Rhodococcus sp. OK519]|uniref:quinone oxidoreductase family protein n=1 Tax=Rhodococcus sp. OK519 TaxID=2135729 RepID=UPI000D3BF585|nr:NADPH2:quinone reductase [Rhodococcus sp. OK519]